MFITSTNTSIFINLKKPTVLFMIGEVRNYFKTELVYNASSLVGEMITALVPKKIKNDKIVIIIQLLLYYQL